MTDIKSMTERQLADFFKNMGQPAFRAKQVFTWLHRGVRDDRLVQAAACPVGRDVLHYSADRGPEADLKAGRDR